jgi:hypothetical protein
MSNRHKKSAPSSTSAAQICALLSGRGTADFSAAAASSFYQKPYQRRHRIPHFICPERPLPDDSLYRAVNIALMFVPSWVSKCNAVGSRSFVRQNIRYLHYVFGSGHWGVVQQYKNIIISKESV